MSKGLRDHHHAVLQCSHFHPTVHICWGATQRQQNRTGAARMHSQYANPNTQLSQVKLCCGQGPLRCLGCAKQHLGSTNGSGHPGDHTKATAAGSRKAGRTGGPLEAVSAPKISALLPRKPTDPSYRRQQVLNKAPRITWVPRASRRPTHSQKQCAGTMGLAGVSTNSQTVAGRQRFNSTFHQHKQHVLP
jgi:hypothetical protein